MQKPGTAMNSLPSFSQSSWRETGTEFAPVDETDFIWLPASRVGERDECKFSELLGDPPNQFVRICTDLFSISNFVSRQSVRIVKHPLVVPICEDTGPFHNEI
jgi:hypothetical protein